MEALKRKIAYRPDECGMRIRNTENGQEPYKHGDSEKAYMVLKPARGDGEFNRFGRMYSLTGICDYIVWAIRDTGNNCDFEFEIPETDEEARKHITGALFYSWKAPRNAASQTE